VVAKFELILTNLLHLIENTFDRKRIYANPSSYPNPKSNSKPNTNSNLNSNYNSNPRHNLNRKAQLCFRTDDMTSCFDQVYRYQFLPHRYYLRQTFSKTMSRRIYNHWVKVSLQTLCRNVLIFLFVIL